MSESNDLLKQHSKLINTHITDGNDSELKAKFDKLHRQTQELIKKEVNINYER
jgi:hypothetical protein